MVSNLFEIRIILTAVVMSFSFMTIVQTASAGEVLHMKSGDVDLRIVASRMDRFNRGAYADEDTVSKSEHIYVVQYQNHVSREDRQNLTTLGAPILRYLPDDALVIRATPKLARTIEGSSSAIRVVARFDDSWKISPSLLTSAEFIDSRASLHVRLFPLDTGEELRSAVETIRSIVGVDLREVHGRSMTMTADRAGLQQIAQQDAVEWIQADSKFETTNFVVANSFSGGVDAMKDVATAQSDIGAGDVKQINGFESGTKLIGFDAAWARGFTGKGQIVAVADTGLDLGDTASLSADFQGRVAAGFVFGVLSNSWSDSSGHGTPIAGSALGAGRFSKSGASILKGGAYDASIVVESMWSPLVGDLAVPSRLADLFGQAYDVGARVHTNSWGKSTEFGSYDSFAQQTDEFVATHPDLLIVFAAGNSGVDRNKDGRIDENSIESPGTAKNVLTVGASKNYVLNGGLQKEMKDLPGGPANWAAEPLASSRLSENQNGLAAFSSRGPTSDGRIKPEIVAPGTNILSTRSHELNSDPLWGAFDRDYVWSGGTSLSAPLAAGAVAVVRQYLIEKRGFSQPSAALMKAVMIHSATDLYPGQFGLIGREKGQELLSHRPNFDEGYGRVDVSRATDLGNAVMADERGGVGAGETLAYPVKVSGRARLTATLVWTDAAASAGAAKSLVNDLDLILVNTANGAEVSLNDHVNNSEMIEADVMPGDYEIRIRGTNVPQGPAAGRQPFSVIGSVTSQTH